MGLGAGAAIPSVDSSLGGSGEEAVVFGTEGDGDHAGHRVSVEDAFLLFQLSFLVAEKVAPSLGSHCEHVLVACLSVEDWVRAAFVGAHLFGTGRLEAVDVRVVVLVGTEKVLAVFRKSD